MNYNRKLYCYLSHPCVAWVGWFGQKKKTRQLNVLHYVATTKLNVQRNKLQGYKPNKNTFSDLLKMLSQKSLAHDFRQPDKSVRQKLLGSQNVTEMHTRWRNNK